MAKIYVNGEAQEVNLPLSLSELIRLNKVVQPDMVSVQLNEEFVDRGDWKDTQLKDGDNVDFLYFMGGGSK
ncbi:MAG: sulfur carrier protein ThiS [Paludibacteraceae bacterium]|nr:sulfur carrier protein ThiS [Paludibacteraceae bacterium]MBP5137285.1 sulfur carrier protein ThiS [Paludibacteraceae bacterium]MBP5743242.1 sulfur carrier protein ThiS [Paludibacteraceae bacterium]